MLEVNKLYDPWMVSQLVEYLALDQEVVRKLLSQFLVTGTLFPDLCG